MKNIYKIIFVVCISIISFTCNNSPTDTSPIIAKIIGKVTDKNGNLLNGVNIYFVYHLSDVQSRIFNKPNHIDTVELTSFSAREFGNGIKLEWTTATETNNKGFEVQRKNESTNYQTIAFVDGAGTTTEPHNYNYLDNQSLISSKYYYILKQIDFDGSFSYSKELMINHNFVTINDTLYQNYPNPVIASTKIRYGLQTDADCKLELLDFYSSTQMATIYKNQQSAGVYEFILDSLDNFPNNIYKVKLTLTKNDSSTYKDGINILINRNQINQFGEVTSNTQTENGKFEMDVSDLPIQKIINNTIESGTEIVAKKEVTNLITFVLKRMDIRP